MPIGPSVVCRHQSAYSECGPVVTLLSSADLSATIIGRASKTSCAIPPAADARVAVWHNSRQRIACLRRNLAAALILLSITVTSARSESPATDARTDALAEISRLREDQEFSAAASLAQELIDRAQSESSDTSDSLARLDTIKQELAQLQKLTTRCDRFQLPNELVRSGGRSRPRNPGAGTPALRAGASTRCGSAGTLRSASGQESAARRHAWQELSELINMLRSQGRMEEAIGASVALLRRAGAELGNEHSEVAEALRRLLHAGGNRRQGGNRRAALDAEIVKTLSSVLGEDHWRVAEARLDLRTAKAVSRLGRTEQRTLAAIRAQIGGLDVSDRDAGSVGQQATRFRSGAD